MRTAATLPIPALLLLAVGCVSPERLYPGRPLDEDEAVVLVQTSTAHIIGIDEAPVEGWAWEIPPGPHVVTIAVKATASKGGLLAWQWRRCQIVFEARPGRTYHAKLTSRQRAEVNIVGAEDIYANLVDEHSGERFRCATY